MEILDASLQKILMTSNDYIFIKDINFVYRACSKAFVELVGQEDETEIIGKTDYDLFSKELADQYRKNDIEVLKSGTSREDFSEAMPFIINGEQWTQATKSILYDEHSQPIGFFGIAKRYYRVTKELNNGERVQQVLGNVPGGVAVFSVHGKHIVLDYANAGFYETYHGSREYWEHSSQEPINWILKEDRNRFWKELAEVENHNKERGDITYRIIGEDQKIHWINHQFYYSYEREDAQYYYSSLACVDGQKQTEEENERNRSLFESAVSGNGIGVYEYDLRTLALKALDYGNEEADAGHPIHAVMENVPDSLLASVREDDREKLAGLCHDLLHGKDKVSDDIWFRAKGDRPAYCLHVSFIPIRDANGKRDKAYGTVQDVTAQKIFAKKYEDSFPKVIQNNPSALAISRINLTKNTYEDGYSRIKDSDTFHHLKSADGFFAAALASIDDAECRKYYRKTINRENLLLMFNQGQAQITVEYPVMESGNTMETWVSVIYAMAQNPQNAEVELLVYCYDITDRKTDEIIIHRLSDEQYDYVGLINVADKTYIQREQVWEQGSLHDKEVLPYKQVVKDFLGKYVYVQDRKLFRQYANLSILEREMKLSGRYYFTFRTYEKDKSIRYKQLDFRWLDHARKVLICTQMDVTLQHEQEVENARQLKEALVAGQRIKDLEQTIESIPAGIAVFQRKDEQTDILMVNDYLTDLIMSTRESIMGVSYDDRINAAVHPDDQAIMREGMRQLFSEKNSASFTVRFRGEYNGSYIWINAVGKAVPEEDGSKLAYIIYTDASQQKLREAEFEQRMNDLSVANPSAIRVARLDLTKNLFLKGHTTVAEDRILMKSVSADEYFDACSRTVKDEKDLQNTLKLGNREYLIDWYQTGHTTVSFDFRRYDRGHHELRWTTSYYSLMKNPNSGDIEALVYTLDSQDSILSTKIIDKITTTDYEAMAMINVQTHMAHIMDIHNGAAEGTHQRNTNYERFVAKCINKGNYKGDAEKLMQEISLDQVIEILDRDGSYIYAFNVTTKDGRELRKQVKYAWLDQTKDTILLTQADITDVYKKDMEQMHQLEDALHAAEQASIAKTEFLSRMSHEIRTPMNAIIGLDEIALHEKNLTATMEDHLQKIAISARFLLSLINDILDMSRIESGRMILKNEDFSFEEFITGINTIMYEQCRTNNLEYECILKSYTEDSYCGDRIKLQQVLINILGNAIKFTPSGGKIHFSIEQLSHTKDKAKLRFEVADTGIGISEEFMPHLFEVFTQENQERTTKFGGTGLGLAISKNIVNLMNGEMTVRSVKGIGSVFTIEVELGLSEETRHHTRDFDMSKLMPMHTLIVDDDVIICQHTQMLLKEAGMNAESAVSGHDAVTMVKEHHEANTDYDLVLLDWKMPDMDGIETAREMRKIVGPDVTIIIMTAYDWADIEEKALAAGVDLFMRKPVFVSSIRTAFENVFHKNTQINQSNEPVKYDFSGRRILLAEDNAINAEIAETLLKTKGAEVVVVNNGVEAIEAFSASAVGYFDAVLMDIRMPVMDGLEASKAIRAMKKSDGKTIPIIAMTANAFQEDVELSLKAGMNAHLAKPIETEVLYETLAQNLKDKNS